MSSNKKAEELLKIASLKESFQKDVKELRVKYNIPEVGFFNENEAGKWRHNFFLSKKGLLLFRDKKNFALSSLAKKSY